MKFYVLSTVWALSLSFCSNTVIADVSATEASALQWKAGWNPATTQLTDDLMIQGRKKLQSFAGMGYIQSNCSIAKASQRKNWIKMPPHERKDYTMAVNCLMNLPSRLSKMSPNLAPGAKSRFDDFTAVHINNTLSIHATANFLSWHRLFTWSYETALREECGYQGYQPYWNWAETAIDPINSPMFDGSAQSMGGNGIFEAHNCTNALASTVNPPVGCIPPGSGGGCLVSGPFNNHTVNLAPAFPSLTIPELLNVSLPLLSYLPRCLRRDISPWVSQQFSKDIDISNLITQNPDIYWFQTIMQGNGFVDGFFGVHAGGHYTIGGDPGGDFFASPGDPAFFLHHAQIDRTWWMWQNLDLESRQNAISGTITLNNTPPSRNGTLEDWLEMGVLGTGRPIKDVMTTTGGELCYVYV